MLIPTLALCLLFTALSLPTRVQESVSEPEQEQEQPPIYTCAVSVDPRGIRVAVGNSKGRIVLLKAEDGTRLMELGPESDKSSWMVAFSPDGSRLASVDRSGRLVVWNFAKLDSSGRPHMKSTPWRTPGFCGSEYGMGGKLLWSPSGEALALGYANGMLSLWSAAGDLRKSWDVPHPNGDVVPGSHLELTGERRKLGPGVEPGGDPQLAWSLDGASLYTANMNRLQVRDGLSGEVRIRAGEPMEFTSASRIVSLAMHPGGKLLATGHGNNCLRLWDVNSMSPIHEALFPDSFLPDKEDKIAGLAFSPDGKRLALSTTEGTFLIVLDVQTRERIWTSEHLGAHFFETMPIVWSPDSSRVWFAFQCGGGWLYSVNPDTEQAPRTHGHSNIPCFVPGIGVVPAHDGLFTVRSDGTQIWKAGEEAR